jgi:hypothetical protein
MNRRTFLRQAGVVTTSCCLAPYPLFSQGLEPASAQPISAHLTVDESATLATVPADFIGLSYESAQLANPAFFAAANTALIALFHELSTQGVLRLGGGTSEFTAFTTQESASPPPFDSVGPDTSKNIKSDTLITPESLRALRAFLDATNWRCLYGLNLGRGLIARAADEAFYVENILGPRLIAFQLGNEPDAWRNRYRPSTWRYEDYWKEWSAARVAVLARVPNAKFAGPDVSNKMAYVTRFAEDAKRSDPDVILLTSHYYAMGPAGAKGMTVDKLLSPDPKLERDLKIAMDAARSAAIPYRMSEGNSCWNGGEPGVSDTLASALWVVDMMLNFASFGCAGVNLHGGGSGYYTPIAGSLATGFVRRPEFFGMELAKHFVGATLLQSTLEPVSDKLRAYVARKAGRRLVLVTNKSGQSVTIQAPLRRARRQSLLAGPAIRATEGVMLTESRATSLRDGVIHATPYSAVLIQE